MFVATVLKPAQDSGFLLLISLFFFFLSTVLIIPNHAATQPCMKTTALESAPSEG